MKILKYSKYITLDPYENKLSFFIKTKEEVLQELEKYTHIKIDVWVKKINLASMHRPKKETFTINKQIFTKNDFLLLIDSIKK